MENVILLQMQQSSMLSYAARELVINSVYFLPIGAKGDVTLGVQQKKYFCCWSSTPQGNTDYPHISSRDRNRNHNKNPCLSEPATTQAISIGSTYPIPDSPAEAARRKCILTLVQMGCYSAKHVQEDTRARVSDWLLFRCMSDCPAL